MSKKHKRVRLCASPKMQYFDNFFGSVSYSLFSVPLYYEDDDFYDFEAEVVSPLDFLD